MSIRFAAVLALVVAVALAARQKHAARVHIPDHVHKVLRHADANHVRYYPDFKYDGFATPHEAQPKENLNRAGTGPHDLLLANETTRNPHMANFTTPFPKNLQWLLNMFESGYGIPRSYNDILPNGDVYWATQTYLSVGAFNQNGNHTQLDSMIGIQERALTRFGLNLYDAATWQIALALWNQYDVAFIYENNILYTGTTGPAGSANGQPGGITDIRADSADFQYGPNKVSGSALKSVTYPGNVTHFPAVNGKAGTAVKKGPGSFFYRMIGPHYKMVDPMAGSYGNAWKYPWPNYDSTTTWNTYGIIHFNDWKPITGENVWATMLGPLQALGLQTNNNLTNTSCGNYFRKPILACDWKTFDTTPPSVQLGISIIPALLALQADVGTLFHCPWGSKIFPPDPDEGANVSNENNFSGYASIDTLYWVLTNYSKGSSDETIQWALTSVTQLRTGLNKWFDADSILSPKGQLPNNWQVVPQGGHYNSSGYFPVPMNTVGGLAIDCQTWGMTVMGVDRIDGKYGAGFAYNIWQTAKKYAGYYKGDTLCGVGYTDLASSNGTSIPVNTIWSAEWTFGAINMAQVMSKAYADAGNQEYATNLLQDAQSMYNQVTQVWPQGLRFPDGSYVYANKRFFIPWGWFSNPISALCSTAWSVMMGQNCDPFHWQCGDKPALQLPPSLRDDDDFWGSTW
jgi:hypothetical protein